MLILQLHTTNWTHHLYFPLLIFKIKTDAKKEKLKTQQNPYHRPATENYYYSLNKSFSRISKIKSNLDQVSLRWAFKSSFSVIKYSEIDGDIEQSAGLY